ncbi:MAG: TldD/PmbA family protein [Thermodesulfobacteriota bacterium]|jgi:PmbA protein
MNNVMETIDRALKILKGKSIDGYEIYLNQSSHFDIESKDSKVDTLQASLAEGMAVRILKRGRIGFSYATSANPSPSVRSVRVDSEKDFRGGLERTIEDAIASSEATSPDPCFDFAPPLTEPIPRLPIFDEALERVSEKAKIEKAKLVETAARSADMVRIKKVRKASYQEVVSQSTLVNSNGLRFSHASTLTSVSVTAVAEESGESEVGWEFDYSHFINDLDVEKVGRVAGKKALERLGGRRIPSGVFPVLLQNHVASEFLSLLAHSFLAEQVQKGKSPLRGKKGDRFFSPILSLIDDGLHPKGISTSPVDGEGTPSRRTSLVFEGKLLGYLYDRYWANRENMSLGLKVGSTGNSRRLGIKSPPVLGISNLFIEPGEVPLSGLVKDLHQGVMVVEVMGLHTVDPISGDFSLGCSGDWIERGEKVHPVKSIAIAGNLFDLFRKVVRVGEDFRFFGEIGSPSLLVEGLQVSGN